jgi:hypothetical protein
VGVEGPVLEHHADVSLGRLHEYLPLGVHYHVVVEENPAPRRHLQAGEHPQEGRLPVAGGAQYYEELAVVYLEVDVLKGYDVRRKYLVHALQGDHYHGLTYYS